MRFVLDEDVDARCVSVLTAAGHDAWTVPSAGLSGSSDIDVVIYASDLDAVLLTHDREMVTSRRAMPIGRIVRLKGPEPMAPELLVLALPEIVPQLAATPNLMLVVSRTSTGHLNIKPWYGTEGEQGDAACC